MYTLSYSLYLSLLWSVQVWFGVYVVFYYITMSKNEKTLSHQDPKYFNLPSCWSYVWIMLSEFPTPVVTSNQYLHQKQMGCVLLI